jgi:hypothetical protein
MKGTGIMWTDWIDSITLRALDGHLDRWVPQAPEKCVAFGVSYVPSVACENAMITFAIKFLLSMVTAAPSVSSWSSPFLCTDRS